MSDHELAEKAKEIYRTRIQDKLGSGDQGKIVAIDIGSGDFFIGDTVREACEKGRRKYPGRVFFSLRIGSSATYHVGAPTL